MARQQKKERAARAFRQAAAKSAASEADRGAAEVERRARVQRRAAKLLHAAKMPARMEMLQKQKKQQLGGAAKSQFVGGDCCQNYKSTHNNK